MPRSTEATGKLQLPGVQSTSLNKTHFVWNHANSQSQTTASGEPEARTGRGLVSRGGGLLPRGATAGESSTLFFPKRISFSCLKEC